MVKIILNDKNWKYIQENLIFFLGLYDNGGWTTGLPLAIHRQDCFCLTIGPP